MPVMWLGGGGMREAQPLQRGIVRLQDGGKLFRDGGRGGDFAWAQVCVADVLDGASVVFFPCVVVENLFYGFLLALREYVTDVIETSRESGVNLYLRSRGGGIVVGG